MGLEQLLPLLVGGASGLFGGGSTNPQLSPQQMIAWKRAKAFLENAHRESRSAPLSSSVEQQGLANSSALLSQAQRRNMEGLFGNLGPTDLMNPNLADARKDLALGNSAQQGALYSNAYQDALNYRRNLKAQLPGMAQGLAGMASNPVIPGQGNSMDSLLPLLFKFGQQWGQRGSTQAPAVETTSPGLNTQPLPGTQQEPRWAQPGFFGP